VTHAAPVTLAFDGLLVTAVLLVSSLFYPRADRALARWALGARRHSYATVWLRHLPSAPACCSASAWVPLAKAIGAIVGAELGLFIQATISISDWSLPQRSSAGSLFATAPSLPMSRAGGTPPAPADVADHRRGANAGAGRQLGCDDSELR
jgi:hypothetical protein